MSAAQAEDLPFFRECLADGQAYVSQRAMDGLVALVRRTYESETTARVAKLLEAQLSPSQSEQQKIAAANALAQLGKANPAKLAPLLKSGSTELRWTVLLAMGNAAEAAAIPYIKPMLEDPSWRMCAAALDAMDKIAGRSDDNQQLIQVVRPTLHDADGFVRAAAHDCWAR